MSKIGLFFGSDTGNTESMAEQIRDLLSPSGTSKDIDIRTDPITKETVVSNVVHQAVSTAEEVMGAQVGARRHVPALRKDLATVGQLSCGRSAEAERVAGLARVLSSVWSRGSWM